MVALKNLVIGVTNYFKVIINKAFVNRNCNRRYLYLSLQVVENDVKPFQLPWVFRKYENVVLFFFFLIINGMAGISWIKMSKIKE